MKPITTEYLRKNKTGTSCGLVGNKALSAKIVIDFLEGEEVENIMVDIEDNHVSWVKFDTHFPLQHGYIFEYLVNISGGSLRFEEGFVEGDHYTTIEFESE